ncbi:MAG TPA: LLM class F420-dependent oxidoreductase [Candidatus Binataceae bacterium]|nr:LLM class F420-dependent oxidoreductase [Candidatus Binataceae bacterium]
MKVGVMAVVFGRVQGMGVMKAFASHAERLGFSTLWAPEHVVLVDQYQSRYPYRDEGKFPAPTDAPIADPFLTLCTLASATEKIRLATAICLVPEHNPVVLAKVIATLDCLSQGRFTLGVGVGWLEEEFRALGIPWEKRAQRTRECIEAMRRLWGDAHSTYHGEFVNFENVRSYPKPARGAKLPVFFGGESAPALRRVAEYGDGWIGFNLTPDEAAAKIRRIEELLRANGRKRSDVELAVSNSGKPITSDDLKRYRDAGVEEFVVTALRSPHTPEEAQSVLEKAAREWLEPAARL